MDTIKNVKIASVVVTYNRKEKLMKNLKCLLSQTRKLDCIYVIDNASTDGTEDYVKNINNNIIKYIKLDDNVGGSGGFYKGIKTAYKDGFDFIWGMDDDAFPDKNALLELENSRSMFEINSCLCCNCDNDNFFDKEYKQVNTWMFVGFYISREVIDKVGFPRKDFFIYHDDAEYAYRILKNGFKIYKLKNSIIDHGSFKTREILTKKIFNKSINFPKMSDWKLYYFIRNGILLYGFKDSNRYKEILINCPKMFFKLLILDRKQLNIFFKAYKDGILNISGKKVCP